MVKLGGLSINKILGKLSPFNILKSIGNSAKLYSEELNKQQHHKKDLSTNTKGVKNFLVDVGLKVIGKRK